MNSINDIIQYENESNNLDFKSIQYKKENYEDLITDLVAFANANVDGDKLIIIGIKKTPAGEITIIGIKQDEFIDASVYQQVINENVEPDLNFDYTPYDYQGIILGIITIKNNNDKPYLLKKTFKNLKKGDGYIRKGQHNVRLTRPDLENIYKQKQRINLQESLDIYFSEFKTSNIQLKVLRDYKLPSTIEKEKIESILMQRKKKPYLTQISNIHMSIMRNYAMSNMFGTKSNDEKTDEELKNDLLTVVKDYRKHDAYDLFELNSHKINISVLNKGSEYIKDASIQLYINRIDGLIIADKEYHKPADKVDFKIFTETIIPFRQYPEVTFHDDMYIVNESIGDIKHLIPQDVFKNPIHIILCPNLISKKINIEVKIFARNISNPISSNLEIECV